MASKVKARSIVALGSDLGLVVAKGLRRLVAVVLCSAYDSCEKLK
jgi:hypothetical protein